MDRFLKKGIPVKILAMVLLAALILLLIPMLKASEYNVPSADDYSNGLPTYRAWSKTGDIREVLKASFRRIESLYRIWQGTFSAIFLFTLNPMIFGEQYYRFAAYPILIMLFIGIFSLSRAVWTRGFHAKKSETLCIGIVWAIICTQFLPRASQGIYWYTGAVYYTFFFGLSAAAFALLICFILRDKGKKGIGKLIAASLILFFTGGGNLVTGLTTAVALAGMELLLILNRNRDWKVLLIPTLCNYAAFGANVAAPGNAVRQRNFGQPGLVPAVFLSFKEAGGSFIKWFSLPVLALILVLIPVFWIIVSRSGKKFPLPGVVTLSSICLAAVMFYPPIYAMTDRNLQHLGRITNIIFFGMVFLFMFNLFYWMGWLNNRGILKKKHFPAASGGRLSWAYLTILLILFAFGMTRIKWFDVTSISAFRSYHSGEMGNYYHTYKGRLEILKDPDIKDAVLKRYPYRPYVLFFNEMENEPDGKGAISSWYNKDSVIIQ